MCRPKFLTQVTSMSYIYNYESCLIYKLLALPERAPQSCILHADHCGPLNSA